VYQVELLEDLGVALQGGEGYLVTPRELPQNGGYRGRDPWDVGEDQNLVLVYGSKQDAT